MAITRRALAEVLAGTVPLAIHELRGATFEERRARAAGGVDLICTQADEMMYGKKPTGVLTAIITGVAACAYQPGGVTILGLHACTHPHPGCPASATRPPCCTCDPERCTAPAATGRCPAPEGCAWCRNGCSTADGHCCAPTNPMGRLVFLPAPGLPGFPTKETPRS
ncbi:hypothetical protein [Sphaerisporangium sp. TRM90804]|uniref:hypothetical protein n=1 Tax=Sphaerisporangium sp. TRM90804 TaxID=3031113 RepID=UPI0024488A7B|nr:hypothetical protein [Sphaerisporangium sp. TRM90804]MDH2425758.1 hypothetical protein [Sphaerisporangium sp. TRM90804]